MWRRVRKDHLAQCTCARPDVEPIFVWRHTEPRHELAGNQAAPPAYIWLIGITASPYILTFSSHRVSQTTFVPKDTECLPGRIWSLSSNDSAQVSKIQEVGEAVMAKQGDRPRA